MRSLFFFCFCLAILNARGQLQSNVVIEADLHHLGKKEIKAFPEPLRKPGNTRLDASFTAIQNSSEWTLRLDQKNVTDDWGIELNGKRIARLNIVTPTMTAYFSVPPGAVAEGENKFSIVPSSSSDDIIVGKVELIPEALRDVRKLAHVKVDILNMGTKQPVPARLTIVNKEKVHVDLYNVHPAGSAWRNGIIYTTGNSVEFDVPQGEWYLTATRGMEWGQATRGITVFIGSVVHVPLFIQPEVDTTGFIAADTHLHTYTYSGHGDASVDERVASLAGEGVELAIATDHNHFTDYKPRQSALGLSSHFTSVIGNEISTTNGHFNGFPFEMKTNKFNIKETNWVRLVEQIREQGAKYVILNHPRWPAITNSPMSILGLNRAVGFFTNAVPISVDALEVINSTFTVKESDFVMRDWFALLNRGEKFWAVGASDTHSVKDMPGQGRTYIASATDNPAAIDVDAVIRKMQAGEMSVSYGIFGNATVNGAKMGQMTKPNSGGLEINFRVACAGWIPLEKAVVYLNGVAVATETNLTRRTGAQFEKDVKFKLPAPKHDSFLVCVAYGEGLKDPAWPTYGKHTLAITNPIFIDADKDGKYQSPRDTARALIEKIKPLTVAKLETAAAEVDDAIAVQLISEARLKIAAEQLQMLDEFEKKLALKNQLLTLDR